MPLTKLEVDKAKPKEDGKVLKLADGLGLSLWVMPTGAKYWRFKYRWANKEKSLALGVYPEVSLKTARIKRDEARKLLGDGTDPNTQRQTEKLARVMADKNTFEAVAREWHRIKARDWAPRHAEAVLTSLTCYLFPSLGKRPVATIEPQEVLEVLRKVEITGKRDTAKRLRERCNAIFRLGIVSGYAKHNPAADLIDALQPPVSIKHPALRFDELPAFLNALYSADNFTLQTRLLIQIIMQCFTRIGETVRAEWVHIDFEAGLWTIPPENRKLVHKLKASASPHIVPLSSQVLAAFRELEQHRVPSNPYVFPSFTRPMHFMSTATPGKALERIGYGGKNKENGNLVTHGFRATASTILNEAGFNPDAIERQLSHTEQNTVRAAYNRAAYLDERRSMLQAWANYLAEVYQDGKAKQLKLAE
ncbi:tyrosine-type recombinase/integrase [Iodobacter sp. CM08]|uniref:tyrosine-type recombinase/integrase n=1 Tax=Iodobacter sp. CM08 TaxID=3085902 RepID=UPI002981879D|nr:integrase arm-type DNA-binding domain-containing protein [Iodobacter sp. CM08]MDW5418854.1 tyrosine-type recombinase/integrase [Iodobacter sp. CM08]